MSLLNKTVKSILPVAMLSSLFIACEGENSVSVSYADAPATPGEEAQKPTDENQLQTILFDDFEDGDNTTSLGEGWFWYTDKSNKGASTISTPKGDGDIVPSATDNGSKNALIIKFSMDRGEYQFDPYVGWGAGIGGGVDCSKLTGIKYRYKGSQHFVQIEISDVTDSDQYRYSVPKSDSWTEITIDFGKLEQEGWGKAVPFNAANINKIAFQEKGDNGTGEIHIDDIYLIVGAGNGAGNTTPAPEEKVKDMTIRDAVLPTVNVGEIAIANPLQATAMKYLDKGINMTNWLEENRVFDGKFKIDEKDIKLMADNGIKGLRFPIDLDKYVTNRDKFVDGTDKEPTFNDEALFAVLDSFVDWTGKANMSLTIDYHEYDNSYNTTSAANPKYATMMANVWKHVAKHYAANERENIFFELLNEPDMSSGKVTSADWRKAAQEVIDSIRTVDSKHIIIFGDASWYSIDNLAKGKPLNDDKIIYAVHTYDPMEFTHQGASWSNENKTLKNIMFPYDKSKWTEYSVDFGVTASTPKWTADNVKNYYRRGSKEFIKSVVYPAKKWAVDNNVPVIINEFGALNSTGDMQSVLNYVTALREISEELQIPLSHWGYTGQFALFKNGALIEGMDKAYGLKPAAAK